MISRAKLSFESNLEKAKNEVYENTERLTLALEKNEVRAIDYLEGTKLIFHSVHFCSEFFIFSDMAARRRKDLEKYQQKVAGDIFPNVFKLAQEIKQLEAFNLNADDKIDELNNLKSIVDDYFKLDHHDAISCLGLFFCEEYRNFSRIPKDKVFTINTELERGHIHLSVKSLPLAGYLEVRFHFDT